MTDEQLGELRAAKSNLATAFDALTAGDPDVMKAVWLITSALTSLDDVIAAHARAQKLPGEPR